MVMASPLVVSVVFAGEQPLNVVTVAATPSTSAASLAGVDVGFMDISLSSSFPEWS